MRKAFLIIILILIASAMYTLSACTKNAQNGTFTFVPSEIPTPKNNQTNMVAETAAPTPVSATEYDFDKYVEYIDFANKLFSFVSNDGAEKTFLYDEASYSDTDEYINFLHSSGFEVVKYNPQSDKLSAELKDDSEGVTIDVEYTKGTLTVTVLFVNNG